MHPLAGQNTSEDSSPHTNKVPGSDGNRSRPRSPGGGRETAMRGDDANQRSPIQDPGNKIPRRGDADAIEPKAWNHDGPKKRKWKMEPNKLVPVFFVFAIIIFLFCSYYFYHLSPKLHANDPSTKSLGQIRAIIFTVPFVLMLYCYYLAFVTDPGSIPDRPMWQVSHENQGQDLLPHVFEKKKDGDLRNCKWCTKFKPDRTHHCRVLGKCVLKMDHHCPWVFNTIGFWNHKHFFLLLFYSILCLWIIAATMWETVLEVSSDEGGGVSLLTMFVVLYCETLSCFMGIVVSGFFFFHAWLVGKNMTTIEFCEKQSNNLNPETGSLSRLNSSQPKSNQSKFSISLYGNISESLGSNPFLWLVPGTSPMRNGLYFEPNKEIFFRDYPSSDIGVQRSPAVESPFAGPKETRGTSWIEQHGDDYPIAQGRVVEDFDSNEDVPVVRGTVLSN